ncbi:UDP-N-acetylmuramoylalanyl-D-glutamate--2,6-diaminopimelate ligase [Frateuria sp. Soil773]|uniref:UDP-N-acetylmuramoyl-L-alanyl-D-glutamate--2, 6-diaminopimelate ligase n=1 Tax=Frateuria sp. Soil773 TaxID=1736407 RepID=UPI0006FDE617|nr:UDP-N-acetylmuramoyl-L-alanyl-D-glutamate--2,6-diaminopimelate ligase [Frateuria sp. Soil773]KRE88793.1 UDP-N-acetylmuramoylalanyl-D-glutamate--2,6-diaminopimelate ligase [Frateuria sp. Soil773]
MTPRPLHELLSGLAVPAGSGEAAVMALEVSGLALDSRQVRPGDAFFALEGTREHGIAHAAGAVARGARVVLAEAAGDVVPADVALNVPVLWIANLHALVGEIAARFYDRPSRALRVLGVTGTNGKTSTVQMLAQALEHLGHRAATIGTLGAGLHGRLHEGERTTPDAINVQRLLAGFRDAGASHVAMEVSSHALEQGRVGAVDFEVAAFTNLTRDHLDYHGSMQAYGEAKARLFAWPGLKAAALNADDAFGRELATRLAAGVRGLRFSAAGDPAADLAAGAIATSSEGLAFDLRTPWGSRRIHSALLGRFNVDNLLAVAACLGALGEPFERLAGALEALQPVNGRMSRLGGVDGAPLVVVDYAHTPDALEQALAAVRAHCAGQLICVFGCGGERDAGKRPLMGAIAERLADEAIVTDDNPRGEDGDAIVAQIVAGLQRPAAMRVERDRAAAIGLALHSARTGDVVLIAGKGHETYQEGAAGKRAFDDMAVAADALAHLRRERCA